MQSQVDTQSNQKEQKQRRQPESFENWLQRNSAIAPLQEMPHLQIEQFIVSDEGMEQLMRGAKHGNLDVRWWCAHKMRYMADDRCIKPLRRLAKDKVAKVRAEAIQALGCVLRRATGLHTDVAAILRPIAENDPDDQVQKKAIEALNDLAPHPYTAHILFKIVLDRTNSFEIRAAAQHVFQHHKQILPEEEQMAAANVQESLQGESPTLEHLIELLGSYNRIVHRAAYSALLNQG